MRFIGDPNRFAFEIGDYQCPNHSLRHVDIWAGGVRLCIDDNSVYLDQFTNDLADEIKRSYCINDFALYLGRLTPVEMATFVCSTREKNSPNYDIEGDSIYPFYRFLDLGPTTDNLSAFLFREAERSFFVYSFWRDASRKGLAETFQVVELDFNEIISVAKDAMNTLLAMLPGNSGCA